MTQEVKGIRISVLVTEGFEQELGVELRRAQANFPVSVHDGMPIQEIPEAVSRLPGAVVFYRVRTQSHILTVLSQLKSFRPYLQKKRLRVIIVSPIKSPEIEAKFKKLGCEDFVLEPISPRSFSFKVERHIKAMLPTLLPAYESELEAKTEATASKKTEPNKTAKGHVIMLAPLFNESDAWLFSKGEHSYVLGRWLVKLLGPASTQGRWTSADVRLPPGSTDRAWQWTPQTQTPFQTSVVFVNPVEGRWIFEGNRPEFQDGLWTFAGARPRLYFEFTNHERANECKLEAVDSGVLRIARDSENALRKLSAIQRSVEGTVTFKADPKTLAKDAWNDHITGGDPLAGRELFYLDVTELVSSSGEGSWEYVSFDGDEEQGGTGIRGEFLYVPDRLRHLEARTLQKTIKKTWCYEGKIAPFLSEDGRQWGFYDEKPFVVSRFEALKPAVRMYLEERAGRTFHRRNEIEISSEPGQWLAMEYEETTAEEKPNPVYIFVADKVVRGEIDIKKDKMNAYWSYEGREPPHWVPETRQWVFSDNPPVQANDFEHLPIEAQKGLVKVFDAALETHGKAVEERRERLSKPLTEGELDAAPQSKEFLAEVAWPAEGDAKTALDRAARSAVETETTPTPPQPEDLNPLDIVKKGTLEKPALSPLSFAFLASELLRKSEKTPEEIARRFCEYLGSSCGGVSAELWITHQGRARLAGASHGGAPVCEEHAATFPSLGAPRGARLVNAQVMGASIGDGQACLFVFGDTVERLDPDFLAAVGSMAIGFVQGFYGPKAA